MAYNDMREFLLELKRRRELRHVRVEVDKDWEISTLVRSLFLKRPPEKRPALIFDKVKGFAFPVAVNVYGSRSRCALALGTTPKELRERWAMALDHPIPPEMAGSGPCKENVLLKDEVDLLTLPVPIWTPGKDVGPYITSGGCITKDPETGARNVGTYRLQVKGKRKLGIFFDSPMQHAAQHYAAHERLGKPMEIAIVLGSDPYLPMCQVTKVPLGMDEIAVAGGLRAAPLALVRCETIELEVPTTTEIVLEGEVPPGVREPEAPFGETSGYMSPLREAPIVDVKAMTFRDGAVYHCFISQKPPSESTIIRAVAAESLLLRAMGRMGIPGVKDIYCAETVSSAFHVVVSIEKRFPGHALQVCNAIWATNPVWGKFIIVCDEDVNIRDPFDVEWALTYRCDPARDTILMEGMGAGIDPTRSHIPISGKMGLDATIKRKEDYDLALPDQPYFDKVEARWKEYGIF